MDARITITVGGWFDYLVPVTQAHVRGLVLKNAKKHGWQVNFADQRGAAKLPEFNEVS